MAAPLPRSCGVRIVDLADHGEDLLQGEPRGSRPRRRRGSPPTATSPGRGPVRPPSGLRSGPARSGVDVDQSPPSERVTLVCMSGKWPRDVLGGAGRPQLGHRGRRRSPSRPPPSALRRPLDGHGGEGHVVPPLASPPCCTSPGSAPRHPRGGGASSKAPRCPRPQVDGLPPTSAPSRRSTTSAGPARGPDADVDADAVALAGQRGCVDRRHRDIVPAAVRPCHIHRVPSASAWPLPAASPVVARPSRSAPGAAWCRPVGLPPGQPQGGGRSVALRRFHGHPGEVDDPAHQRSSRASPPNPRCGPVLSPRGHRLRTGRSPPRPRPPSSRRSTTNTVAVVGLARITGGTARASSGRHRHPSPRRCATAGAHAHRRRANSIRRQHQSSARPPERDLPRRGRACSSGLPGRHASRYGRFNGRSAGGEHGPRRGHVHRHEHVGHATARTARSRAVGPRVREHGRDRRCDCRRGP